MIRTTITTLILVLLMACEEQPRPSTASDNVEIIEQQFKIPGLDRTRQIRLYLPPDYGTSSSTYPVLYMHDGQNLFDQSTSYAGEWRVDEILNQLYKQHGFGLIVVGIDNGAEKRMTELSPWTNENYGSGEGKEYLGFIVNVVKPYIDANYRSKPDFNNTGIMGSSMGGLISHYAIHEYPKVFGLAGVYSPSYWYVKEPIVRHTKNNQLSSEHRVDFLVGAKEGDEMVSDMQELVELVEQSNVDNLNLRSYVDPEGEHNEAFWSKYFGATVEFLFITDKKNIED